MFEPVVIVDGKQSKRSKSDFAFALCQQRPLKFVVGPCRDTEKSIAPVSRFVGKAGFASLAPFFLKRVFAPSESPRGLLKRVKSRFGFAGKAHKR